MKYERKWKKIHKWENNIFQMTVTKGDKESFPFALVITFCKLNKNQLVLSSFSELFNETESTEIVVYPSSDLRNLGLL